MYFMHFNAGKYVITPVNDCFDIYTVRTNA